ncbi:MAG: LysE family translocator [Alphaproteobacteria bacterium]|nr:LysE family translocator [Alphaproteobacteria bacterium]
MSVEIWFTYLATVLALMSTPGPSQLLMLSNSATHGFKASLATIMGDLSANILQMLAAGFGLSALIAASSNALNVIKWFGVIYLVYLGIRMITRARPIEAKASSDNAPSATFKKLWLQGFLTSAANPKAIVFFAALFPQFIVAEYAFGLQFIVLSVTYIFLDSIFLSAYGLGAEWIATKFKSTARVWIERIGGGFMIGAALLLGLKSLKDN